MKIKKHISETVILAVPVVIGQLGTVMMNVQDNMMVGFLGPVQLSAATLANNLYFILCVIPIGGAMAISSLVSEAYGQDNINKIGTIFKKGLWVTGAMTMLSMVVTAICIAYLHKMGQPVEEVKLAAPFLVIINISTIPLILFMHYKNFLDGLSETKPGMYITLAGLSLNVLLNWAMIFGHLGFPAYGMIGAAIATLLSRVAMFGMVAGYVHFSKKFKKHLSQSSYAFSWPETIRIAKIAFPLGFQFFFEVAAFGGAAIMIGWMHEAATARSAHQIALSFASISFMFYLGIATASSIRVGNFMGMKQGSEIFNAAKAGGILLLVSIAFWLSIMMLFKGQIGRLFGMESPEVLLLVSDLIWLGMLFQIFDATQVMASSVLRGLQDVRVSLGVTFVAYWVICLPLGYWLSFNQGLWVFGIWWAFIISLAFVSILLGMRCALVIGRWQKKSAKEKSPADLL